MTIKGVIIQGVTTQGVTIQGMTIHVVTNKGSVLQRGDYTEVTTWIDNTGRLYMELI